MMKHKFLSTLLYAGLTLALLLPCTSKADVMGVEDAQSILLLLEIKAQEAFEFAKKIIAKRDQLEMSAINNDREIQTQNNIAANTILRTNKNRISIANNFLKMQLAPAVGVCQTNAVIDAINNNTCFLNDLLNKLSTDITDQSLGGDPNKPYQVNLQNTVQSVYNAQQGLVKASGDQAAGVDSSDFLSPQMGGYTKEQEKTADLNRQLIVDPRPVESPIPKQFRNKTDIPYSMQKLAVQRDIFAARKSMAAAALAKIESINTKGPDGVSEVGMMQKFVNDHFLNKEWVEKISNTHPDKSDAKNITTPAQVQRAIAIGTSFNNYMAVETYKLNEKSVALEATQLLVLQDIKKRMNK